LALFLTVLQKGTKGTLALELHATLLGRADEVIE
jgi:hypothetical protein